MTDDQPVAPNTRTFSMNSEEGMEAICGPRSRHIWAPMFKDERWPRKPAGVWVSAETHDEAAEAFADWLGHVEAGRIGAP